MCGHPRRPETARGDHRQDVHPHKLRHTFARHWIESGGDIVALGELLGHKSLQTTRIYAKPSWQNLEDAAEQLYVDY